MIKFNFVRFGSLTDNSWNQDGFQYKSKVFVCFCDLKVFVSRSGPPIWNDEYENSRCMHWPRFEVNFLTLCYVFGCEFQEN